MTAGIKAETKRVFPSQKASSPKSTPLSIIDATVARFTATGAIWIFSRDQDPNDIDSNALVRRLEFGFVETLSYFPQWAGQLQWAPLSPQGGRSHRPMVVYGTDTDPGVEWTVHRLPERSAESLTTSSQGQKQTRAGPILLGDDIPQAELAHAAGTPLALHDLKECEGLAAMQVQVTLLEGGDFTVAIHIAQPLADAHSLLMFTHHWAAISRTMTLQKNNSHSHGDDMIQQSVVCGPWFPEKPVFAPHELDAQAAGNIDASCGPDPILTSVARSLPMHRYDWWAQGQPSFLQAVTENSKPSDPEFVAKATAQSPGTPPPWDTWDMLKPVRHAIITYSAGEIAKLRSVARQQFPGAGLSSLDALIGHVWSAVNRARGYCGDESHGDEEVYLNMSLGCRQRVSPPLGSSFVGSPLFMAHAKGSARQVATSPAECAAKSRETLKRFTPDTMGAILHDVAHDEAPQRLWRAFLGRRHVLVTSWLRLGVYEVDFLGNGQGINPRLKYVHAIMPKMDGCVQIMEAGSGSDGGKEGGMDVSVYLEASTMERLLRDEKLKLHV